MRFSDRDTMTADDARNSKTIQRKSRMQKDEITAEILKRKEQENED